MNVGDKVKVLPPFGDVVTEYTVLAINADGVIFVEGIEGGFSPEYLKAV
jgi:formylmethanofuran dehydrogenase subunit D